MTARSKSPITDKPLRMPGQTLSRQVDDTAMEIAVIFSGILLGIFTIINIWWKWYHPHVPHPLPGTITSLVIICVLVILMIKRIRKIKNLRLGRDGEIAVGQFLERMQGTNSLLFHDIPGDHFNLDHVLVSNQGIFVIETKTISKPIRGNVYIRVKDGEVYANQFRLDRNPIVQATAEARWLGILLEQSTGKKFPIQPVVLFPGWYVDSQPSAERQKVWLLEPKALPAFVGNRSTCIKDEDVHLVSFHLSRYIRNHPSE